MKIGEIIPADREITLNEGKKTTKILNRNSSPGHAGIIGLKLITILKDIGSFFVEGFSLLGQTQLISFSGKKADPEFNLQIADSHGNGGLGHI